MTPPSNNNQLSISTLKVEYNNLSATEVKLVDSILKTPPKQFKSGMTARVFELPGNKICRIQSKTFTNKKISAMKAMANTLNWQMACIYAHSKHVPKIYFVGFVGSKKSPSVVVTVMEKLASAHRYANNRMFEYLLVDIEMTMQTGEDMTDESEEFLEKNKKLGTIASFTKLGDFMCTTGLEFNDVHSGNVMIRPSTGCLVITDPIA